MMMRFKTALILGAALTLAACGQPAADSDAADTTAAASDTAAPDGTGASGDDAAMAGVPAMTSEEADQAFRCNALFTAAVAGRIGGQMEPLPADLDSQVRTSGAAFWNDRELAAIANLGLSEADALARASAEGERVIGRRAFSEEDLTDLRACVAAMG